MLKLGLSLSLSSIKNMGGWSPDDETSLVAWYKNATGITLNGSDVRTWADSSSNSHDMQQATASEQPAYSNGVLTFDSSNSENLQTSSQITLDGKLQSALEQIQVQLMLLLLATIQAQMNLLNTQPQQE